MRWHDASYSVEKKKYLMQFSVQSSLFYQVHGPSTLLCSLCCIRTAGQHVSEEKLTITREVERHDMSVGFSQNRFTKLEVEEPGELAVHYSALARTTVRTVPIDQIESGGVESLDPEVIPYLFPSRYAPADRMRAVADDLFGNIEGQFAKAQAIEDWLNKHIQYSSGSSNEQSWALDTFELRSGVCRDFAHLGIAFCRALTIPARYVTVYAHELQWQDFHAVFEVYIDGTWFLFDGTRLAPLNGMIRIAVGRDASDAAVATLYGNVAGQGINVSVGIAENESEAFQPLTREDLNREGKALFLI